MRSYRKELWFNASQRRQIIHITPQIEECLRESGAAQVATLLSAGSPHLNHWRAKTRFPTTPQFESQSSAFGRCTNRCADWR